MQTEIGSESEHRLWPSMADLGTPAAGSTTPNPAAGAGGSSGKQPMSYICGGEEEGLCYNMGWYVIACHVY